MLRAIGLAVWAACASIAQAQERVALSSFERVGGGPVVLNAYWFAIEPARGASAVPAVVLLHGCSGPYDRNGALGQRMVDYARLLNANGMEALVVDSLTARGETELCTQRVGSRRVTQANRRLDALAAVAWLAARPGVDAGRIGLMGWSNGGSTVLSALNLNHAEVAAAPVQPAFAVAFYPGCEAELKRGFETRTKLLMLVGEADDWTPAAPCHALASAGGASPTIEIEGYGGAFHGFDSTAPVRLRADVPNGVHPGAGVHVGGDMAARGASQQRLLRFLAQQQRP